MDVDIQKKVVLVALSEVKYRRKFCALKDPDEKKKLCDLLMKWIQDICDGHNLNDTDNLNLSWSCSVEEIPTNHRAYQTGLFDAIDETSTNDESKLEESIDKPDSNKVHASKTYSKVYTEANEDTTDDDLKLPWQDYDASVKIQNDDISETSQKQSETKKQLIRTESNHEYRIIAAELAFKSGLFDAIGEDDNLAEEKPTTAPVKEKETTTDTTTMKEIPTTDKSSNALVKERSNTPMKEK